MSPYDGPRDEGPGDEGPDDERPGDGGPGDAGPDDEGPGDGGPGDGGADEDDICGLRINGQVSSLLDGVEQKGLILSRRFYCLLASSPTGLMTSGSIGSVGFHSKLPFLSTLTTFTNLDGEPDNMRQETLPLAELTKWN